MRHRARSLHVTLLALALAVLALLLTPHASARADAAPKRYVIAIDPGHGGAPNDARPDLGYDAGASAADGTAEKDLTLDVAKRLRAQLEGDLVQVVLTREDDRDVTIDQRSATANGSGALLFVSIHFNSFPDPGASGSLVLYPGQKDIDFARVMDARMSAHLSRHGIPDDGPQLRDNWWIHVLAPAVTVEPAYLSNPREEAFLTSSAGKEEVASGIRDGIEAYKPDILARKQLLLAARAQEAGAARSDGGSETLSSGSTASTVLHWLLLVGLAVIAVHWRRPLWTIILAVARLLRFLVQHSLVRRNAMRRRRRRVRARSLAGPTSRLARPHSVYDELFL